MSKAAPKAAPKAKAFRKANDTRELRIAKQASAREAIGPITPGQDVFVLTFGQFSLIDVLVHVLDEIGPASVDISTWTAAHADVQRAADLMSAAAITKLLSDRSEVGTPAGRLSIAVCVAQDLAVVPMILTLPLLAGGEPQPLVDRLVGRAGDAKRPDVGRQPIDEEGAPLVAARHHAEPRSDQRAVGVAARLAERVVGGLERHRGVRRRDLAA